VGAATGGDAECPRGPPRAAALRVRAAADRGDAAPRPRRDGLAGARAAPGAWDVAGGGDERRSPDTPGGSRRGRRRDRRTGTGGGPADCRLQISAVATRPAAARIRRAWRSRAEGS